MHYMNISIIMSHYIENINKIINWDIHVYRSNFMRTENSCTLIKSKIFIHLNTINIEELREIVSRLSQNKPVTRDFY